MEKFDGVKKLQELQTMFESASAGLKQAEKMKAEMIATLPVELQKIVADSTKRMQKHMEKMDISGAMREMQRAVKTAENLNKDGV